MNQKLYTIAGILALLFVSASCTTSPEEIQPLDSSHEQRALSPSNGSAHAQCPGPHVPEYWMASVETYIASTDSVFVGTVSQVHQPDTPLIKVINDKPVGEISVEECHAEGGFPQYSVAITFEEITTLAGLPLPSELTIVLSLSRLYRYGLEFIDGSLRGREDGNEYFHIGARIGGGLLTVESPEPLLTKTLFEVHKDTVYLHEPRSRTCITEPAVHALPDEFDGAPFASLVDALAGPHRELTDVEEEAVGKLLRAPVGAHHFGHVCVVSSGELPPPTPEEGDRG